MIASSLNQLAKPLIKPLAFLQDFPLILLGGVLLMLGMAGVWVNMPLSGNQHLAALSTDGQSIFLAMAGLFVLYLLATALKRPVFRVGVALIMLLFLITLAQSLSFFNGDNISLFTAESQQFREMQHILALHDVPNAGRAVETRLSFDAFTFKDRLATSFGILGWGPKLALLAAGFLFLYALMRSSRFVLATLLSFTLLSGALLVNGTGDVVLAYLKVNHGLRALNQNNAEEAVMQLTGAAELDPVFNRTSGYLLLLSYVSYQLQGPDAIQANAYLMNQRLDANDFRGVLALYAISQSRDTRASFSESAMRALENAVTTETLNRMALLHMWRNEWYQAEKYYRQGIAVSHSPVGQLAMLDIYYQTRQLTACIALADDLLATIQNRSVGADILTSKGDCLVARGRILEGRDAYEQSIKLDSDKNYRAVKGLSGT